MERGSVKSLGAGWDSKGKEVRAGAGASSCLRPTLAQGGSQRQMARGRRKREEQHARLTEMKCKGREVHVTKGPH